MIKIGMLCAATKVKVKERNVEEGKGFVWFGGLDDNNW